MNQETQQIFPSPDLNTQDLSQYELLWQKIGHELIAHYGKDLYNSWFSKIMFFDLQGGDTILLAAPSHFIRDWIKSNYFDTLYKLWIQYDPVIKRLEIITKENIKLVNVPTIDVLQPDATVHNTPNHQRDANASFLDPRFTFDSFVIGSSNELAYAAAYAIAESDHASPKSNPLFLHGGVGLGKTHLMHAIAWHNHKRNPNRKILYMSAEKFMYRFIHALRNKDILSFKEEFRSVDVLMIDDIQFICGKESTQAEFFHTFNAIVDNNKQMIISCDRSPSALDNIEERIKSRLNWGLVADVHNTTYELRVGILESKLEQMDIQLTKNVLHFLAAKIISNVRELEGALNKIIAHSTLISREITIESIQDMLRDLLSVNTLSTTIEDIQQKVAERYNIQMSDMYSSRRLRAIARPRQIAMYLAKNLTSHSLANIGVQFGNKDHTTVMHAIKKIEEIMHNNPIFKEEVTLLANILYNTH